jgi:Secretion system C-terminal sorting domain
LPAMPIAAANGSYNFGFSNGTFAGCMYAIPNADGTTFELGFNGTNTLPAAGNRTTQSFALNTTIMVVMAYTPGASGSGTVSAWVNPNASSFGGAEPVPTFNAIAGGSAATASSVFIRSGSGTNPMNFDELRVANNWASVTSTMGYVPPSLPIYEPFALNLGSLTAQNTWSGDFAGGSGAQVVNTPLSYPGLASTPGTKGIIFGSQINGGTQALGFPSRTSRTFASFLIQLPAMPIAAANSSYNFGFGSTTAGGTFAGCMYAIPNADGTTFELGFNGTNTLPGVGNRTTQSFPLNTATIMVVMAYTPGAAGTGAVSAWVNPDASSFGGAEPTPSFANILSGSAASVASVFIRSGAGTNQMNFDELRIGTTWAEVTSYAVLLPVSISGLKLSNRENVSTITWKSHTEINFDKYTILYSGNGTDFTEVGSIKGKGSNNTYSFNYAHNSEGFFKLKMIDADGRFVYSDVLYTAKKGTKVKIGPNPFTNTLFITDLPEGQNNIVIYNVAGAKIKSMIVNDNKVNFPVSMLANGNYILRIMNNGKTVYNQILIKK